MAHNIHSPQNVGSLFRIADALGVEKIYLSGKSICPPNQKLKKTSRSTEKFVNYDYKESPIDIINQLKEENYTILSLELTSKSVDIKELSLKKSNKICLIVGSENHGVNQELLDISDYTIHIPMYGKNTSMNLATACAIGVYELSNKLKHH